MPAHGHDIGLTLPGRAQQNDRPRFEITPDFVDGKIAFLISRHTRPPGWMRHDNGRILSTPIAGVPDAIAAGIIGPAARDPNRRVCERIRLRTGDKAEISPFPLPMTIILD